MGCSNPLPDGSVERDCNSVDLLYLDGASFSGYRAEPWAVPGAFFMFISVISIEKSEFGMTFAGHFVKTRKQK
jgi:hypothetical protein